MLAVPGNGVVQLAIARPAGQGPFPAIIILHGSHGFAREYVQLAKDMADSGVLAIAPCWFSGGGGAGAQFVTPINCPAGTMAMPMAASPEARLTVDAVVSAVHALPDVRPQQVAIFGHSRGGGAALNYLLGGGQANAIILDSAGYPEEVANAASGSDAPILILHGTADAPDEGGSVFTSVAMAQAFEAARRQAGKPVEANYYEGGTHNGFFNNAAQHQDELRRIKDFLRRHFQH